MIGFRFARFLGVLLVSSLLFAAAPAFAEDADARAELIGLWEKMLARRDLAFKVSSVTTTGKGKPINSVMQVQWPNRFHMKSDQSEMIILPGGTWMNMDGKWMKMPIDMQKMIAQFTPEMTSKSIQGTKNVRFVGLDTVKGKPVKVYLYDFDSEVMGINSSGTSKIFLSVTDGYPLRIETTGTAMRKTSTTIADYEYDDGIDIQAPR
jgi:outer membrane lipoprotein-sorting protein